MVELTHNEMMEIDGGEILVGTAILFVASVALGYNIGTNIFS